MKKLPEILDVTTVASSRLFRIEELHLRFANGVESRFERLSGSEDGAVVMIVPVTAQKELLFINEYSAGTHRYELVFPKGRIDPGETSEQAAQRELREETGFAAEHLVHLKDVCIAPGYATFETHIWLAWHLSDSPLEGDEPEPLELVPLPLDECERRVNNGMVKEARTMLAIYLLKQWMQENDRELGNML